MGWGFVGCGGSGSPGAGVVLVDGEVVGVEFSVAGAAEQNELVEVGLAFAGGVPGHEVVGLAAGVVGAAAYAGFVAGDECVALHECGVAFGSAEPQGLAVFVVEGADDVGVFEVVGQHGVGNEAESDLFGECCWVETEIFVEGEPDKYLGSAVAGFVAAAWLVGRASG